MVRKLIDAVHSVKLGLLLGLCVPLIRHSELPLVIKDISLWSWCKRWHFTDMEERPYDAAWLLDDMDQIFNAGSNRQHFYKSSSMSEECWRNVGLPACLPSCMSVCLSVCHVWQLSRRLFYIQNPFLIRSGLNAVASLQSPIAIYGYYCLLSHGCERPHIFAVDPNITANNNLILSFSKVMYIESTSIPW
jgi:hypothetical protein